MGTLFILNIDTGEKTGLILAGWGSQERYLWRSEGPSGYFRSFWGKNFWLFNMYNFTSRLKTFPFGSQKGKRKAILQYLEKFWKTKGKEEWNSRGSVCPVKVTWGRISQNRKREASFIWHGISEGCYCCSPNISGFLPLLDTEEGSTTRPPCVWVAPFCRVLANEWRVEGIRHLNGNKISLGFSFPTGSAPQPHFKR